MAAKQDKKNIKGYRIRVKTNPNYVGVGAGGVQFAYGQATVHADSTIVGWYREHEGYEVTEITEEAEGSEGDAAEKSKE